MTEQRGVTLEFKDSRLIGNKRAEASREALEGLANEIVSGSDFDKMLMEGMKDLVAYGTTAPHTLDQSNRKRNRRG